MYPCEHGDLLYKTYGLAYCRCHQGYEGTYCNRRVQSQDHDSTGHWWSGFLDGLKRIIWGPSTDPPVHIPHNTVNVIVPPSHPAPFTGASTASWATTASATTESAHFNEASGNDYSFVIGFLVIVFAVFCISCAAMAFCCWKIRSKKDRQKRKNEANGEEGTSASCRPRVAVMQQAIEEMPGTAEDENEPPTYEQAIAEKCTK